jgi:HSP20 family molecular chaperone IbpA
MTIDTKKLIKSPEVTYDYIKKKEALNVSVELPGVKPGTYSLNIATCGFCISAETSNIQYKGCYRFYHEVDADNAEIIFRNGTLTIKVPFFAPLCGKQFPIDYDV